MRRLLVIVLCAVAIGLIMPEKATAGDWAVWFHFGGNNTYGGYYSSYASPYYYGYGGGGYYYGYGGGGYYGYYQPCYPYYYHRPYVCYPYYPYHPGSYYYPSRQPWYGSSYGGRYYSPRSGRASVYTPYGSTGYVPYRSTVKPGFSGPLTSPGRSGSMSVPRMSTPIARPIGGTGTRYIGPTKP